ncbi:hypothetical protein, partial [uncultured Campylobacter sp.]|uniref:hypothetical protein n=1 Tax=uncultured Campylobacter sp. TaxID=218934 RepID=UPI00262ABDC5
PASALSALGKTRRRANGSEQISFKILNPRCDMKFCAVSARRAKASVNFKIPNRLRSGSGVNFKFLNPLRGGAGVNFKNLVAVRKPKRFALRNFKISYPRSVCLRENFKNFIVRPFLR